MPSPPPTVIKTIDIIATEDAGVDALSFCIEALDRIGQEHRPAVIAYLHAKYVPRLMVVDPTLSDHGRDRQAPLK